MNQNLIISLNYVIGMMIYVLSKILSCKKEITDFCFKVVNYLTQY